jgi:hypothetical protein
MSLPQLSVEVDGNTYKISTFIKGINVTPVLTMYKMNGFYVKISPEDFKCSYYKVILHTEILVETCEYLNINQSIHELTIEDLKILILESKTKSSKAYRLDKMIEDFKDESSIFKIEFEQPFI